MNEAVIKDRVIEEDFNFTFRNGEFVEVKQEEIEQKPEYLLEQEFKTETNDDYFENTNSDEFPEDIKPEPKESDSPFEKVPKEAGDFQCEICQKMLSRKLLKMIKSEEDKTVLSEIFKVEGFGEINPTYVCYSHIQAIIDDYDGKLKLARTSFERVLRSFIKKNKTIMKVRKSRRQNCQVCHMNKPHSEFYDIYSKRIRMVIMIGCILRDTHSIDQAISYITNTNGMTCYSHRKESIDMIFDYLGISEIQEFFRFPRHAMGDLVNIAKNFDSDFTEDHFFRAFSTLYMRKPKNAPKRCPLCSHERAYFMQLQTRSADEPITIFYRIFCAHLFKKNTTLKEWKSRRQNCQVCHMNKPHSEFYDIYAKRIRMVIMIGSILRGTHSVEQAKMMKIEEEILQLMNYVPERTKNATSPMNLAQICRNFDAKFQPCLTLSCINKRLLTNRLKIPKMQNLDMDTKIQMMFALSVPLETCFLEDVGSGVSKIENSQNQEKIEGIDEFEISKKAEIAFALGVEISERFFRELRESAEIVEIDTKNRITKYITNDLKFEGIHEKSINLNLKRRLSSDKENVPAEKSARKSEISEELSLKEFLRSLLLPIRALKSPMMTRVEFRIEAICFEEGSDDKKIPIKRIHETLVSSLRLLTTPSSESNSESTCLFDFFYNLEIAIRFIRHPIIDSFQNKMKELISEHANDQEEIPMINARSALEAIIDAVINV
ncbi:hypothetical protein L5515_009358 [Caenorhabditis briggsae]|uniref:TFIIS-type domain-containing protein n=1 Tax=Caenorhabditis briggsae TaxID=6238 RepID=A0AAE9F8K0_CAEBR|nr:hypothetical protein L5515_009358 [Caenorhabditis briggsae]